MEVDSTTVTIRHKTGRDYRVQLTKATRVISRQGGVQQTVCTGIRAIVLLEPSLHYATASEIRLFGDCP